MDEEAPYVRLRDDVVDEIRDERDAQPQVADEPAEHVVVREVIRQGIEAADRAERLAPARDRRAKRVMQWLDVGAEERRGEKPLVDEHGAKRRRHAGRRHAAIQTRHQPDARFLERTHDGLDIVGPDAHVAVDGDQYVVVRAPNEIGEIADLQVGPDRPVVDHELELEVRKVPNEPVDDGDGRIVSVTHTEDDLEAPIVLPTKARKVFVQLPVVTSQRLQDRDGRRTVRTARTRLAISGRARERGHRIERREYHRAEEQEVDGRHLSAPCRQPSSSRAFMPPRHTLRSDERSLEAASCPSDTPLTVLTIIRPAVPLGERQERAR